MTEPQFAPLTELLAPSRLQPINLRVKACLIEEARRHKVNISEVLGRALFQTRAPRLRRHCDARPNDHSRRSVEMIFRGP